MFGALLIGSTAERSIALRESAAESRRLMLMRVAEGYPSGGQLVRLLNSVEPEFVLLDMADADAARSCAACVASVATGTAVIGFGGEGWLASLSQVPQIAALVSYPPAAGELEKAIDEALHRMQCTVDDNLIAFLPSKAGSGATTVALNTAVALAGVNRRVLLIECDLRSGVLAEMLNLHPTHSIQQVLLGSDELDRFRLENAVAKAQGVDLLLSSRSSRRCMPEWGDYYRLLQVARSRYDVVVVDLPELVNPATREIVQRCRAVYNVCTPELLSVRLAEQRIAELADWGVADDRVFVILNRWQRGDMTPADLETRTRRKVAKVFPNDYPGVRAALIEGVPVSASSTLGRSFKAFAREVTAAEPPAPQANTFGLRLKSLLQF